MEFTWGVVVISPCADLYATFWVHLLRELPLTLPPGLFWSAQPSLGVETTPPTRRDSIAEVVADSVAMASAL